jgi:hypothetical protein
MKENSLEIIKEQARFYLNTPEKAAEALLFVRNLERFAKEVKEKVKERTVEIMDRENKDMIEYQTLDTDTGEIKIWQVKRDYGKQSKEYNVGNVIEALGMDAKPFLKVAKTEIDKWMKRESAKGNITMQQVDLAVKDPIIKLIKGSGVRITEVKAS